MTLARDIHMRTVQMTLDPDLVDAIDSAARRMGVTRSAFARQAFADALDRMQTRELERRHAKGYARKPVRKGEFDGWIPEQVWPDRSGSSSMTVRFRSRSRCMGSASGSCSCHVP